MVRLLLMLLVCSMVLMSCGGMSEEELWSKASAGKEKSNPKERIQYCRMLIEKYPNSAHAPDAMWKAATICSDELKEYATAVQFYKDFSNRFPQHPDAPKALFLTAFLYNNEIRNTDSARVYYSEFARRYPNNELAASAKYELENLGKEAMELIPPAPKPQIAKKRR